MDEKRAFLHRVGGRFCLAGGVGEDEIMQRLEDAPGKTPDPEKYLHITATQSLMDNRFEQASAVSESPAQARVRDRLGQGVITPGMKDRATSPCRQNEASFDAFLEKSGRVFSKPLVPTHTTGLPPDTRITTAAAESEDTASICRQLGLDATALNS